MCSLRGLVILIPMFEFRFNSEILEFNLQPKFCTGCSAFFTLHFTFHTCVTITHVDAFSHSILHVAHTLQSHTSIRIFVRTSDIKGAGTVRPPSIPPTSLPLYISTRVTFYVSHFSLPSGCERVPFVEWGTLGR